MSGPILLRRSGIVSLPLLQQWEVAMNKTSQPNCPVISPHLGCWNQYICERGQIVLWITYGFVKRRSKYSKNSGPKVSLPFTCHRNFNRLFLSVKCKKPCDGRYQRPLPSITLPRVAPRLRTLRSCTAGGPVLRNGRQRHVVATCVVQPQIFHRYSLAIILQRGPWERSQLYTQFVSVVRLFIMSYFQWR